METKTNADGSLVVSGTVRGDGSGPAPRRYLVTGYCLVPALVSMEVTARSQFEAEVAALAADWEEHITEVDKDCAHDWKPSAREL